MKKDIPKIYVNNISKIYNNEEVYYSYKDNDEYEEYTTSNNSYDMRVKIDELFRSNDFVYKKKFHIKTKYDEKDYIIISKSYDYLLSINGEKIYIDNIIEIY
jgi:hypothetical protein